MICFLTSRMDEPATEKLNPANHLTDELRLYFPNPCRALHICSDPDSRDKTDYYAAFTKNMFEEAGFSFECFSVLDGRNEKMAAELVRGSNLIILSGGHVPTQNRFFARIGLRGLLEDFNGVLIGISAGSMNSAEEVYAFPEKEGEAVDPGYQRFLPGLRLTKTNLLPHYQANKDDVLDGMQIYEEIACPDSVGRTFYAVPDGTYLFLDGSKEELRGEAYTVKNGALSQVSSHGDVLSIREAPYTIRKVKGTVDWERIPAFAIDRVLWTEDTGIRAGGQLCHDGENLYVRLFAKEEEIRAEYTAPLSPVYQDSCLEFFFTAGNRGNYFNFEINPKGCLLIQTGAGRNGRISLVREDAAEYFGIRTRRTAAGWEASYRIPLDFLRVFRPDYSFSGELRANAYKCGDRTAHRHYLAWHPVLSGKPDFHRPEDFGRMLFEE